VIASSKPRRRREIGAGAGLRSWSVPGRSDSHRDLHAKEARIGSRLISTNARRSGADRESRNRAKRASCTPPPYEQFLVRSDLGDAAASSTTIWSGGRGSFRRSVSRSHRRSASRAGGSSCTSRAVSVSKVSSSPLRARGWRLRRIVRANAMRCFSPPRSGSRPRLAPTVRGPRGGAAITW